MINITKKPLCIFTTGLDQANEGYAEKMLRSLRKTNPDIDKVADVKFFKAKDAVDRGFTFVNDLKMRYMTPIFAQELLKEYDCVVRLDADMIITGDISDCWKGDFDVAVVQNGNPREVQSQIQMMGKPVNVWDIDPVMDYVNCGFVVMKSEAFVDHWMYECERNPQRQQYQFFEQDFLNILVFHGPRYKVKFLDKGDSFYGLASKGYYPEIVLKDGKLVLPKNSGTEHDLWPLDCDKEIKCLHWAGPGAKFGDIDIRFSVEVATYLKDLITDDTPKDA